MKEDIKELRERRHQEEILARERAEIARTILRNYETLNQITDHRTKIIAFYGRDFGFSDLVYAGTSTVGLNTIDTYRKGDGIHSENPVWLKLQRLQSYVSPLCIFGLSNNGFKIRHEAEDMQSKMRNRTMTEQDYNFILENSIRKIKRKLAEI